MFRILQGLRMITGKLLLTTMILTAAASVGYSQSWEKVGGTPDFINCIYFPKYNKAQILVGADSIPTDYDKETIEFPYVGDGYKESLDSGKTFGDFKLKGFSVFDFLEVTGETQGIWLAAVNQLQIGSVIKSTDNGSTWLYNQGGCNGAPIMKLAQSRTSNGLIYGAAVNTCEGFKYSGDLFANCSTNTNLNVQSRSLVVSKKDTNLIFIAGDKICDGGVFRSLDGGKTWSGETSGLEGLRVLCVMPSAINVEVVYCGADSVDRNRISHGKGLYRSLDTGKTWELIAAPGAYVYQIAVHPSNPKYMAAACGTDGVWMSANDGGYWKKFSDGFGTGAFVTRIAMPDWEINEQGMIAFAGVAGQGLYKSGRMITSVEDNTNSGSTFEITKIYPQPANDKINIGWRSSETGVCRVIIRNYYGEKVAEFGNGFYPAGENQISWLPEAGLPDGIYIVTVESGTASKSARIIRIK